jgi:hypothetical protein
MGNAPSSVKILWMPWLRDDPAEPPETSDRSRRDDSTDEVRARDLGPISILMLRIELTGSGTAGACGLVVRNRRSPVTKLCRQLVAAGHDPAEPAGAYRGAVLCLYIRSIGELPSTLHTRHGACGVEAQGCCGYFRQSWILSLELFLTTLDSIVR